jgi:hypothetical protein
MGYAQLLLTTIMHEAGEFQLVSVVEVDGRPHYSSSGVGKVFSVVRLEMDKQAERRVREEGRQGRY